MHSPIKLQFFADFRVLWWSEDWIDGARVCFTQEQKKLGKFLATFSISYIEYIDSISKDVLVDVQSIFPSVKLHAFTFSATATIGSFKKRPFYKDVNIPKSGKKGFFLVFESYAHYICYFTIFPTLYIIYCVVRIPSFGVFFRSLR